MKSYPIMWRLKYPILRIPIHQPGFNGKSCQVFFRGSLHLSGSPSSPSGPRMNSIYQRPRLPPVKLAEIVCVIFFRAKTTRWAPGITPTTRVISPFITARGPTCRWWQLKYSWFSPRTLGRWSKLDILQMVGEKPPTRKLWKIPWNAKNPLILLHVSSEPLTTGVNTPVRVSAVECSTDYESHTTTYKCKLVDLKKSSELRLQWPKQPQEGIERPQTALWMKTLV